MTGRPVSLLAPACAPCLTTSAPPPPPPPRPQAEQLSLLPTFYAAATPASQNETWLRLNNDPLFAVRGNRVRGEGREGEKGKVRSISGDGMREAGRATARKQGGCLPQSRAKGDWRCEV